MKVRLIIFVMLLSVILPSESFSQFGGVIRRAVNKQINNELDTAINKKIQEEQNKNAAEENEAIDDSEAEESEVSEDNNADAGGAAFSGLFGNKVSLKYKEEYSFTSRIHMVTEQYDNKDVMKMNFYMFYSNNQPSVGIETQTLTDEKEEVTMNAKMVMDGENKVFIMLSDINGMKMGTIMEVPDENTSVTGPDGKPVKNYKPPVFTKTGNTRVIAGYKCDEYTYKATEDNSTGKVWFAKDARLKINQKGWNSSGMSYYYESNQFNDGIILANEAYDEKGKPVMKSETIEINENFPHKIGVAGYTLRQMNLNK